MKKTKNIIKLLFYTFILFSLSGCSVNYNIKIDDKLNTEEELYITEDNFILETINKDKNYLIDNLIDKYAENDNSSLMYIPRENILMNVNSKASGATVIIKYEKPENLEDSEILNKTVESISVERKGLNYTVKINNFFYSYMSDYFYGETKNMQIDKIIFSIELPFYVNESNADKIEKNKYIWNLTEENSEREMYLTFNKNKMASEGIQDLIIKYIFITLGGFIIIILLYLWVKSKKNNAI